MTTQWKPTEPGTYRWWSRLRQVEQGRWVLIVCAESDGLASELDTVQCRDLIDDEGWSLLSPDWQEGAPTAEQLTAWRWWAIQDVHGDLLCAEWEVVDGELLSPVQRKQEIAYVAKSAPIQPDWTDGPRFVPLSVAGGK